MKPLACSLLLGLSLAVDAHGATLCDQLEDAARTAPTGAWAKGGEAALQPLLSLQKPDDKPTPIEAALVTLSAVKKAVGNDGFSRTSVEHLAGSDLYMASQVQGTLDCQTSAFVRAASAGAARMIAPPRVFQGGELCWTQSGDFGTVAGQGAFIVHGADNQETDDETIEVTPWTGAAWGPACALSLTFRMLEMRTERDCTDAGVCAAADKVAGAIVAAYERWPSEQRDTGKFWYGAQPASFALATLKHALEGAPSGTETPDFPSGHGHGFSYSGFTYFPLTLNGQTYIAAIGHDGVGWRESNVALLAIYAGDGVRLKPLAGYAFERNIAGLASAVAGSPKPAKAN